MFSRPFEKFSKAKPRSRETNEKPNIHTNQLFSEKLSPELEVQTVGGVPQQPDPVVKNNIQKQLEALEKLRAKVKPPEFKA